MSMDSCFGRRGADYRTTMNSRKLAFEAGLAVLDRPRFRAKRLKMSPASDKNGLARADRYNARGCSSQ